MDNKPNRQMIGGFMTPIPGDGCISRRDYFAGCALTGIVSRPESSSWDMDSIGVNAFKYADALLKAGEVEDD